MDLLYLVQERYIWLGGCVVLGGYENLKTSEIKWEEPKVWSVQGVIRCGVQGWVKTVPICKL